MSKPKKKKVERQLEVDKERLFANSIEETIAYLTEVHEANPLGIALEEKWHGYEDNEFVFVYEDLETDAEFERRMQLEQERLERERRAAEERVQNEKDVAAYKLLCMKLGKRP